MRLVKAVGDPKEDDLPSPAGARDFRLFDDHGKPMRWVKSVSFKVDPSEGPFVIMTIERYIVATDEVDISVSDGQVIALPVEADEVEANEDSL